MPASTSRCAATSADGSTADKVFTIAVNDVDEFDVSTPADTNARPNAVAENSALARWWA
jgi:hypothetical protein